MSALLRLLWCRFLGVHRIDIAEDAELGPVEVCRLCDHVWRAKP